MIGGWRLENKTKKKRSPDCTTSGDAGSRKGELVEEEEEKKKKELTKTVEDQEQRRKEDEKKSLDGEAEGSPVELFLCRSSVLGEGEPRRC